MELAIMILSWVVSILFGALILSVPTDAILSVVKKDWRGSEPKKIYNLIQLISLGVFCVVLLITIVLMTV